MVGDAELLSLDDYLGLNLFSATAQWRGIIGRPLAIPGRRQPPFTAVETLLCFGLGMVSEPGRSGRVNIRESDTNALLLAKLFKRPVGSLALKYANLDGRRANGAKHEQELWIALTHDKFSVFETIYAEIIQAGRNLGLGASQLPDFLGVEDNSFSMFVTADQISDGQLFDAVEPEIAKLASATGHVSMETEKAVMGTARVGQQQFARAVLRNSNMSCVFCGLSFLRNGLPSSRMLVASHIKPWSASTSSERTDPRNGLGACPTHDAAFDSFLISVGPSLEVLRSRALEIAIESDPVVRRNFGSEGLREAIVVRPGFAPGGEYLRWHTNEAAARAPSVGPP